MSFKIATWNVNSIRSRIQHVIDFINSTNVDILCLQEIKCETDKFPKEIFEDLGYNVYVSGQKTYNGVAILSKFYAEEVSYNFPNNPISDQARFLEIIVNTEIGLVRAASLYAPNGNMVGSSKFSDKLSWYNNFIEYLDSINNIDEKIILCGDYNIAPFEIDMYNYKELEGQLCCTYEEQAILRTIFNMGFIDNFRFLYPELKEFSWWDYRAGAFRMNKGLRIDGVISNATILPYLSECSIMKDIRALEKPSDHAPVIAEYSEIK